MKRILYLTLFVSFIFALGAPSFAQNKPKLSQPILITSAGQSADVTLAGMLCKRLSLTAKTIPVAKASDLDSAKTLIIVAGFSSKGLGAAGVSREQELNRVKDLISAAKTKKIPIMFMHIGGKARRGGESDDFNKLAAEASTYMLVVKQGDDDKFFSTIASKGKIPIELIDKIADAAKPLGEIFK